MAFSEKQNFKKSVCNSKISSIVEIDFIYESVKTNSKVSAYKGITCCVFEVQIMEY